LKWLAFILLASVIVSCKKTISLEKTDERASGFKQKGGKSFVGQKTLKIKPVSWLLIHIPVCA